MLNDKAKLGIGILAAVLITTAVLVPVSIFADRAIHKVSSSYENGVQVWGYDDQISSTAEKINDWMGVTKTLTANTYGGQDTMSSEPTLLLNSNYHTVEDDIQILDGVAGADEGLGYLSTAWVSDYSSKSTKLRTLSIYDEDNAIPAVDGTDHGTTTDSAAYLDPMNDDNKEAYRAKSLSSILNMHLKIPVYIANLITISADGIFSIDREGEDAKATAYFEDIASKGYADDFIMQIGFFTWVATSKEADDNAKASLIQGTTGGNVTEFTDTIWNSMQKAYEVIGGKGELEYTVKDQEKSTSQYSIAIDGTGTNTGLISAEVEMYQEAIKDQIDVDLYYDLVNGGSEEGWKVSKEDHGEDTSDAREYAFLGTQSRFPSGEDNSESLQSFWGYTADSAPAKKTETPYDTPVDAVHTNKVIGFTTGIDLASFFVKDDMTFEYQLTTADGANALTDSDVEVANITDSYDIDTFTIDGTKYHYGDTVKVKPTGITREGARQIYEMGNSYTNVLNAGLMIGEIVE